jgi:hypothetical protein
MAKSTALIIVMSAAFVLALTAVYGIYLFATSPVVKFMRIRHGAFGDLVIGETKEMLLSNLPNEAFSPRPRPSHCGSWISASTTSSSERTCLMSTNRWDEAVSSGRDRCPEQSEAFTSLEFKKNKLVTITTVCLRRK